MARKKQPRSIHYHPKTSYFRPDGIGIKDEGQIILEKDEVEALRLVDFKKEPQKSAAENMSISQPTLSRILGSARSKVAEAIITGKAIKILGGNVFVHPSEVVGKVKKGLFS